MKRQIKKRRKKFPSLSAYVVFSIVMLIAYTIAELLISSITNVSHDTLSTCYFSTFGGEILACAIIKIYKLKGENNNE